MTPERYNKFRKILARRQPDLSVLTDQVHKQHNLSAIIPGAEKDGISPQGAELADEHVIIPMNGMVSSLNVSVAAAVILIEAQRQREMKGMYASCRLPEDIFNKTLFRWGYPELTRYCDERLLAYPQIDDHGQLINPADWYNKIRTAHLND